MYKEYDVEIEFIGENQEAVKEKIHPLINPYDTDFTKFLNDLGIIPNPKLRIFDVNMFENGVLDFTVKESEKDTGALEFIYDLHKKLVDKFFPEFYINIRIQMYDYEHERKSVVF